MGRATASHLRLPVQVHHRHEVKVVLARESDQVNVVTGAAVIVEETGVVASGPGMADHR